MLEVTEQDILEARESLDGNAAKKIKHNNDINILDRLSHKHRARAFWRKFGYIELQQVNESLSEIMKEKETVYLSEQKKNKSKQILIEKISSLVEAEGLTISDVISEDLLRNKPSKRQYTKPTKKRKYGTVPLCYKVRIFGRDFYWTGIGAAPIPFRCAFIERGTKKSDYKLPYPVESTSQKRNKKIPVEYIEQAESILSRFRK